jgi:hypothetical protein
LFCRLDPAEEGVLFSGVMRASSWSILARSGAALLIVVLIGGYLLEPRWKVSRQRAEAFDGVIEKKEMGAPRVARYRFSLRYILVIRQKTGGVVRYQVPWNLYEQARVGMPVRKRAGEQWPILGASASP